jgi:hypothetical protein
LEITIAIFAIAMWLIAAVGLVWAVVDAIGTSTEKFKAIGRNKWIWIFVSLVFSFVGVYYVSVVRRELKGETFPMWAGEAALWLGALVTFFAFIAFLMGSVILAGLIIPMIVFLYLGLHPDEWTGDAAAAAT